MKEYYNISEIASLFGLCPDTLRYYEEKGLLHPVRGENRYRMYGIQDICTLNVIRSLRELDMPVERIRDFLCARSVEGSLALVDEEEALLTRRMAELEALRREARDRRERLERYRAVPCGRSEVLEEPERPFIYLREDIILEKEIDFLLKKLEKAHQDCIRILGRACMGAVLDESSLERGVYNHYACVFFLTGADAPGNGALPAGRYARRFYRGAYAGFEAACRALDADIRALGLSPAGPPLELYRIDAHDTGHEAEYVTEIQRRVQ